VDTVPLDSMVRNEVQMMQQNRARAEEALTPEVYMREDSTMPRVVAEWYATRANREIAKSARNAGEMLWFSSFFARNLMELASLTGAAAAERWLQARDQETAMLHMLDAQGCPIPQGLIQPRAPDRVLAAALETDSTGAVMRIAAYETGLLRGRPTQLIAARWYLRRGRWYAGPSGSSRDHSNDSETMFAISCEQAGDR
jgi:hypothetical protein